MYKKKRIYGIITIYIVLGLLCFFTGVRYPEENYAIYTNEKIELFSDEMVAQRILGNDLYLDKFSVLADLESVSKGAILKVYLLEGSYNIFEADTKYSLEIDLTSCIEKNSINIHLPRTKLLYNRDYFIAIQYIDQIPEKSLGLFTNSDIQGVYKDNINYGIGLSHSIKYFAYQSKAFFIWLLFFVFGGTSIALCMFKKIYFSEAISIVTIISALWMFFWSIADHLRQGYYFFIAIAFMVNFFLILWIIKTPIEDITLIWKEKIKGSYLCWILLVFAFLILDAGNNIKYYDELSHWGIETQELYMFNQLPFHSKSQVALLRYPPISPLFQYLFLQLYGKSSASIMILAKHFFEGSFLLGCFTIIEKKKPNRILFGFFSILVCIGLPELFSGELNFFYTLFVDILVGTAFAYVLVRYEETICNFSCYNKIMLIVSSAVLVLIKENGLIFISVMLGANIVIELFEIFIRKMSLNDLLKRCKAKGIIIGGILFGETVWNLYINTHMRYVVDSENAVIPSGGQVSIAANLGAFNKIAAYIKGDAEQYQYNLISSHLCKLGFDNYFKGNIINFSFLMMVFMMCIMLIVGGIYLYKDKTYYYNRMITMLCMCTFIIVIFHILYTFIFPQNDAVRLASESRYLGSFLLAIMVWVIYILCSDKSNIGEILSKTLVIIGLMLTVFTGGCSLYREHIVNRQEPTATQIHAMALRKVITENDRVYWVSDREDRNEFYYFKYYLLPAVVDNNIAYPNLNGYDENHRMAFDIEEWKEDFSDYDYLYIDHCDESLREEFGDLFDDPEAIRNGVLFRIVPKSDKPLQRYQFVNE
jgi:hypothetical protein